jgi:hypothetical protein
VIAHVVTFSWLEHVTEADVDALEAALAGLPAAIPVIRGYHFGRDLGLRQGNADFGVVALVDDAAALVAYLDDPAHKQLVSERIRPMTAERRAAQITWGDED